MKTKSHYKTSSFESLKQGVIRSNFNKFHIVADSFKKYLMKG